MKNLIKHDIKNTSIVIQRLSRLSEPLIIELIDNICSKTLNTEISQKQMEILRNAMRTISCESDKLLELCHKFTSNECDDSKDA